MDADRPDVGDGPGRGPATPPGGASAAPPQPVLVDLARAGDEAAFAALVRAHQGRAYRVALRMTGTHADSQDVVQEAFLQAWQSLPRFRGDAQFGTWLIRIVLNRCHNLRRAARPVDTLPDDPAALTVPGADTTVAATHLREAAREAILQLPFDQRAPLVLHSFAGFSHAEVARVLGITEGASKVRVHRARRTLTALLQDWR